MKELVIRYEEFDSLNELSTEIQLLVKKAYEVAENAYAPYSNFQVGAAVLLDDSTIVLGSNQENAAYPSGMCAERTALFYAGANFPTKKIKKIVIVSKGIFSTVDDVLSPCGSCRQVLIESEKRQGDAIEVILVNQNNKTIQFSSAQNLLPFAFGC